MPQGAEAVWRVRPSGPLVGEVTVAGSKNAVTKHMVAALLTDEPTVIDNAPHVGDVDITAEMLRALGASVERAGSRVHIDPHGLHEAHVPMRFSGRNRIPILLLGPLLHRFGEAFVPLVGGDQIGSRPVDYHVEALRRMGAEIEISPDGLHAKTTGLRGARVTLPFPSVGATENILLTAVLAEGRTVIENAALEPEIVELSLLLQRMGAIVERRPDRRWIVEGVPRLHGAVQRLDGDRLEAFSYLVAGLVTGGQVRVHGTPQARLVTGVSALRRMGAQVDITDTYLSARAGEPLHALAVQTETHPGFMTDWQQPLAVLCTQAQGLSVIHETVFEDRFGYVGALREMGAQVELFDQCLGGPSCRFHETPYLHSAVIRGGTPLRGTRVGVPDVRGGFAYLLAAAIAAGETELHGVHHIERGYHRPLEQFRDLGLAIDQVP
ncbi:MAG: UDP-N-acetylglucosamine 1-carboxyvinyltransferase [Frankiaceae bacterium]